jgi:hypothetical protein
MLPPLPPVINPVELVQVPQKDPAPMIQAPDVQLPAVPVATGASPRHERRRRTVPAGQNPAGTPQTPAVDAAPPAASPEETAIGALSLGGEANPRAQQEAAELIESIDKRINGLDAQKVDAEKGQVSRIKNFQRQAQGALNSGDVEGAKTLATKAKLLLDDLQK